MYILKNAYTTICRNKGRNFLIGIIVLVIAIAGSITLSIRNSAEKLIDSYKSSNEITATIGIDRKSIMDSKKEDDKSNEDIKDQFNSISAITVSDLKNYADSDYITDYYYTLSLSMNSSNIEKATSEMSLNMPSDKGPQHDSDNASFSVIGYSSYSAMTDFVSGTYKITDGKIDKDFTSNSCIINEELASVNNLNVGDNIVLTSVNDATITYELKITGIYTDNDNSSDNRMDMFSKSVNNIITNNTVISNISNLDSLTKIKLDPTFILKSADSKEKFENELKTKGLDENYTLSTNLDSIENETKAIDNLSNYAVTFLIIILIVGSIVLLVINMINIRERKYEIGVLRTMGMKKRKVITQFVVEILIVSTISLSIGTLIGAFVSVPTANKLLENEINSSNERIEEISENFGGMDRKNGDFNPRNTDFVDVNKITEINAVVDFKVLTQLLGIGIALGVVSSVSAMVSISRFSPLTILKERS